MHIAIVNPEIPQNTGSIARLCAGTGSKLSLVGKLGFALDSKHLKRAGLDYWPSVFTTVYPDIDSLLEVAQTEGRPFFFFSKKAKRLYTEVKYVGSELLIFGSESSGLPPALFGRYPELFLNIPILDTVRSLNLSGTVHLVVYHILASLGFPGILR